MDNKSFPPLSWAEKDFCHFPRRCWYESSPHLPVEGNDKQIKILLIRPSARGDSLLMEPIARAIKHKFPNAIVDVASMYPELFANNPNINSVIRLQNKKYQNLFVPNGYDYKYWMSYEFTPKLHIVDAYANIVGIEVLEYAPKIYLLKKELDEVSKKLSYLGSAHKFIATHTECDWKTRMWSEDHWQDLINLLWNRYQCTIIDFSLNKKKTYEHAVGLVEPDIRQVAGMLSRCRFMVCIDSGLMHIGAAMDIPMFPLFSITDPDKRLPRKYWNMALQPSHGFSGIHHRGPPPVEIEPILEPFLDLLQPEDVFKHIINTMEKI